ncbi:hypothetical protein NCU03549 [Neurospora crassa OR74A]|uniref:Peroxin 22-like protein n=1 Tax=Neurospora crassa (strain ATCC 24698 / 74-OR23-1A / CBS 708.71 / DSM 1257 / FGSC 987) TaxID=367110 RepID=Q1K4L9_NEUCR|nr:hypothetical protein NCU03549 [Neurospora crassa OR74A]EAA26537.2 hypothetical protein NCU03549 [Neurospora crassa OR74A]|eukprot:XP_955773.2 hypothetical protein NCU03549 [Neurospora crassa OR74A]
MSDNRRRNGPLGTWVPLVVTAAVATVSVAAWIWSQRKDRTGEHDTNSTVQELDYENADYGDNPPYGATGEGRLKPPAQAQQAEGGWGPRRTPSPADFFNSAKRQVAAGVTAAGAAVENATPSRNDTPVVQPTTSTAPVPAPAAATTTTTNTTATPSKNQRRKKVAIIVSADNHVEPGDEEYHEHASILSHIPRNIDLSLTKLYILIYAPQLKDKSEGSSKPASLSSSFSNIEAETPAETPAESKDKDPLADSAYTSLYNQAAALVSKPSHILTFSTPAGHSHILRHIQPEIIYLQESLAGPDGSVITSFQTWLRHDIVLVVGAEQGDGGLADSDSEDDDTEKNGEKEKEDKEVKWWQKEERVGRGRGVVVVDVRAGKLGDDWVRRVQGQE